MLGETHSAFATFSKTASCKTSLFSVITKVEMSQEQLAELIKDTQDKIR